MVNTGKQKYKSFKRLSDLDKMISKYKENISDTERYLRGIKQGVRQMKSVRKDLKGKDVTAVLVSLNPLK